MIKEIKLCQRLLLIKLEKKYKMAFKEIIKEKVLNFYIELILIIFLLAVALLIFKFIKNKKKEKKKEIPDDKKPPDDIYPLY